MIRTILGILVGVALAGGLRASLTSERVLVAADWDGDPSAVPLTAGFVNLSSGTSSIDLTRHIEWTPVPGAQAYKLFIGTAAGAADVLDSGPLTATSYRIPVALPANRVLYARLWTQIGGVWRATDASRRVTDIGFTVSRETPKVDSSVEPIAPHD